MMNNKIKTYTTVIAGLLLVALSFNLFLSPNNLVAGGVSGASILARELFGIKESVFIYISNFLLVLVSLRFLGIEKTKNTLLGSILFPVFISLTENISQRITFDLDILILAVLGGALSGIGYGLIFRNNFTTGGTDILNQIAEKYLKIPMGKSILMVDGPIVVLGLMVFGLEQTIYSLIVLILISTLSNRTMFELNKNRVLYIQTDKVKEIQDYLSQNFYYDTTIMNMIGGYTRKKKKMILCTVSQKDYYQIKEGILLIDSESFITVTKAYEQKNANKRLRSHIASTQNNTN